MKGKWLLQFTKHTVTGPTTKEVLLESRDKNYARREAKKVFDFVCADYVVKDIPKAVRSPRLVYIEDLD